jgi:hypothetical protein
MVSRYTPQSAKKKDTLLMITTIANGTSGYRGFPKLKPSDIEFKLSNQIIRSYLVHLEEKYPT